MGIVARICGAWRYSASTKQSAALDAQRRDAATWQLAQQKKQMEKTLRAEGKSRKEALRIVAERFKK